MHATNRTLIRIFMSTSPPLPFALHALPTGDLTTAGCLERGVADLESVGPPGACMTPSIETMAPTMLFRMSPLLTRRARVGVFVRRAWRRQICRHHRARRTCAREWPRQRDAAARQQRT